MTKTEIPVGLVSTRHHAKLHLIDDGQAHCRSGLKRIIPGTTEDLTGKNSGRLCKRCRNATRQAIADQQGVELAAQSTYSETAVQTLSALDDTLMTDTERETEAQWKTRRLAELRDSLHASGVLLPTDTAERMAVSVELAPAVMAQPPADRPRTLRELRDLYARTLHQVN